MRRSPVAKRNYKQLFVRIEKWLKKNAPSTFDDETYRSHLYNLYLTVVGFRQAFMPAGGMDAALERFARDFNLIYKHGPYFDIVGDHTFLVNPKYASRLEPLFRSLERGYSSNEKVMAQRFGQRSKIIGQILGYHCLGENTVKTTVYFVSFLITEKQMLDTFLFGYLCNLKHRQPLQPALTMLGASERYLQPIGVQLEFKVGKFW